MNRTVVPAIAGLICVTCATTAPPPASPDAGPRPGLAAAPAAVFVPVEYHTLPNGLRVVLTPDHTSPRVTVALSYGIGHRVEPKDRSGFAHLFEHLMFQGSRNLGKGEFFKLVQANGGVLSGSTEFDSTNYYEIVPSNMLRPMLWAEADRMKGLNVTEESLTAQKGVVSNEAREWVLNRPYGGFPWLDVPQVANVNWYNAHDFSSDLVPIEAATLEDARAFFNTWYVPNNAALAIVGDFEPAQAMAWVAEYFGGIASRPLPPKPDISEPRQETERRASRTDGKATRAALAIAYHAPEPESDAFYAMALINHVLASGKDSWLYDDLVRKRGLTGGIEASMHWYGTMFNVKGPTLYTIDLFHDPSRSSGEILKAVDESIDRLRTQPVDAATLARARVKMRSAFYRDLEGSDGSGRANLLAFFALFYDDPARINRIESRFAAVTPELIRRTAEEYLRPGNRTIVTILPETAPKTPGGT